jgi:uncharacterized membrane protein YqgA involved in biofilm formation
MQGPIVNAVTVIVCALLGAFLIKGKVPSRFDEIIKKAIGLSTIFLGLRGAFENQRTLLLIMSLIAGSVIGELINIDKMMSAVGNWAERKLGVSGADGGTTAGGNFSRGFVSASILFCTGSMAIVGSIQSGLEGNHEMLYAKSVLDGAISLVFGASLGVGVAFSAIPVLLYQGAIALAAMAVRGMLTPEIIREMSAAGSLLIAAIGFNFITEKNIRVANMLPAVFIPWVYIALENLIKG